MASLKHEFRAKTWTFWATILISGPMSLVLLGLAYFIATTPIKGRPPNARVKRLALGTFAGGLGLLVIGVGLPGFQVWARRKPLVRLCREGVESLAIGETSLDDVMVPRLVRFVWGIVSTQSFRTRTLRAGWAEVRGARVEGLPGMRVLIIDGHFDEFTGNPPEPSGRSTRQIIYQQAAFKDSLPTVAKAIKSYATNPPGRADLRRWSE